MRNRSASARASHVLSTRRIARTPFGVDEGKLSAKSTSSQLNRGSAVGGSFGWTAPEVLPSVLLATSGPVGSSAAPEAAIKFGRAVPTVSAATSSRTVLGSNVWK